MNINTKPSESQVVSFEVKENLPIDSSEVLEKFLPKKLESERIACLLMCLEQTEDIHENQVKVARSAKRMSYCSRILGFGQNINDDGTFSDRVLKTVIFCHDRLCPICSWRRSAKLYGQIKKASSLLIGQYKFAFLTLTIPSVYDFELSKTIDKLLSDFNLFMKYKAIRSIVKGYIRSVEVTYNSTSDTYHPHIHCVIALPLSYTSSVYYLNHSEWLDLWQKACRNDSITQVDIRMIKDFSSKSEKSFEGSIAEVAKYSFKSKELLYKRKKTSHGKYILTDDPLPDEVSLKILRTLIFSLSDVRLFGSGGVWRKALSDTKADDINSEKVDLVHISDEKRLDPSKPWLVTVYTWVDGYRLFDTYIEAPEDHACNQKQTE